MSLTILGKHDSGCRYAREEGGGHSEAAARLMDRYNLHKLVGERAGWIQAKFADGDAWDSAVFATRQEAVNHSHHNEQYTAYINLQAPHMTLCEAASLLRFQAHERKIMRPQVGEKSGLVVIPRLTIEDQARQLRAMSGHGSLPIALGKVR